MLFARVVKLVDAGDSKSPAARRAGSIPAPGTISEKPFLRMQRRLFRIESALKVDYRICDRQTAESDHPPHHNASVARHARGSDGPFLATIVSLLSNPSPQTDIMCAR
jgi:hypothetical protein